MGLDLNPKSDQESHAVSSEPARHPYTLFKDFFLEQCHPIAPSTMLEMFYVVPSNMVAAGPIETESLGFI